MKKVHSAIVLAAMAIGVVPTGVKAATFTVEKEKPPTQLSTLVNKRPDLFEGPPKGRLEVVTAQVLLAPFGEWGQLQAHLGYTNKKADPEVVKGLWGKRVVVEHVAKHVVEHVPRDYAVCRYWQEPGSESFRLKIPVENLSQAKIGPIRKASRKLRMAGLRQKRKHGR